MFFKNARYDGWPNRYFHVQSANLLYSRDGQSFENAPNRTAVAAKAGPYCMATLLTPLFDNSRCGADQQTGFFVARSS